MSGSGGESQRLIGREAPVAAHPEDAAVVADGSVDGHR